MKASMSLTTVLTLGAILTVLGLSILLGSIDTSIASNTFFSGNLAKLRLTSCLEESLQKLAIDPNFASTVIITFPDGTCQASVSVDGINPNQRNIVLQATTGSYTASQTKKVDISTSPYTISN